MLATSVPKAAINENRNFNLRKGDVNLNGPAVIYSQLQIGAITKPHFVQS
jgi:hypothetical protein